MTFQERLTPGNGGWVRYQSDAFPAPVFVRLEDRGGRLVPVDLFIPSGDEGIDTSLLRAVPMGRIEAWANEPSAAEGIKARLLVPGPDLRRAASHFCTTFGSRAKPTWATRMLAAQVEGSGEPQAELMELAPPLEGLLEFADDPVALALGQRLIPPAGRNYGDGFYRRVAWVYGTLARRVRNPVAMIAEANDTPLSTVQRWVREARHRGFLPAAQAGKRG